MAGERPGPARIDQYNDLLATLRLYINWRHVTRQQKTLFADAVDAAVGAPMAERWWDWPTCAICPNPVELRDGRWLDLRGRNVQSQPVSWAEQLGLTPAHVHRVETAL
jgi:hypothetical protein